ncbi:MAG TPA: GNAT family N-acetyltransferase, partial [Candidatus Binatus sp.]|nr:GNAT family N-acetyltransferase [Candidatus Binatus sp.]
MSETDNCLPTGEWLELVRLALGFEIRKALREDSAGIGRVHVDTWRTTYRDIIDQEYLANLSYQRGREQWEGAVTNPRSRTAVFVAVDQDHQNRVVGFAACGAVRDNKDYDGDLYAIYILQDLQGKGIGRKLVSSVANELISHSFSSMLVWVLAQNPCRGFYEALGGEHVLTKDVKIAEK